MNTEIKDRLRTAAESIGGLRRLSEKSGIVERTIANWAAGVSEPKVNGMAAVADATGVSLDWLIAGKGPMSNTDVEVTPSNITFPSVPRYNVAASAGHGAFNETAEILDEIPYTQEFLLKKLGRTNTDGLILIDAEGDSMEPFIGDGDLIMLDTNKKRLTSAVYAFQYDGTVYVKRINHTPDAIHAKSDNPMYDTFTIEGDNLNQLDIIGRVVWVGHMM